MKKDKSVPNNTPIHIAILVDGDNTSTSKLGEALEFASRHGQAIVRRIYGDWTKSALANWKEPAKEFSFRLIEALPYVKGKNTSDIALVIDAMDLLHTHSIQGFCIVASDSDYTLLAQRFREDGLLVLGYGETKTLVSFVNSCKKFVFSDKDSEKTNKVEKSDTPDIILQKEAPVFDKAFDLVGKEEVTLSQLGAELKKILPKYKPRRYGCKTLGAIYEKLDKYELLQTGEKGIYGIVRKKKEIE